jgi:hypothetical protein
MTPERAADKEKRALFRALAFFLSDLKLGMTKLLTLSISLSYPRISSWPAECAPSDSAPAGCEEEPAIKTLRQREIDACTVARIFSPTCRPAFTGDSRRVEHLRQ